MNDETPLNETEQPAQSPTPARPEEEDRAELAELKDRHLRLAADFENYKRRTAQESERRAGAQKDAFITELLPVMDNLERALSARSSSAEQLRVGVEMTLQQLDRLLRDHGCSPIEGCGQPFDPRWQEAIASRRDPACGNHSVLEVVQRGWRRGERLLRPAKVIVNDSATTTDDASDSECRQPLDEMTEQ